ncbi:MAG TPA: TetR/AcrR family transcriptional regulator [Feifaniaceae bacterium]|nr:TetR/AcrR family transcriptional regulator [Feifaniaceae bacterium]
MERKNIDQRVRLTRTLLKDALVQIMQTQHISKISVRALCDLAGVNRSTFYAHYSDQYDLLHQLEQEVIDNLKRYLEKQDYHDNRPISTQVLTRILEYAQENANLFQVLLSENCDFAFQKDIMELAQVVSFKLNPAFDARVQGYLTVYGITGCISILQKWLQDGLLETPEKVSEVFLQVLYHGIVSFE